MAKGWLFVKKKRERTFYAARKTGTFYQPGSFGLWKTEISSVSFLHCTSHCGSVYRGYDKAALPVLQAKPFGLFSCFPACIEKSSEGEETNGLGLATTFL